MGLLSFREWTQLLWFPPSFFFFGGVRKKIESWTSPPHARIEPSRVSASGRASASGHPAGGAVVGRPIPTCETSVSLSSRGDRHPQQPGARPFPLLTVSPTRTDTHVGPHRRSPLRLGDPTPYVGSARSKKGRGEGKGRARNCYGHTRTGSERASSVISLIVISPGLSSAPGVS